MVAAIEHDLDLLVGEEAAGDRVTWARESVRMLKDHIALYGTSLLLGPPQWPSTC